MFEIPSCFEFISSFLYFPALKSARLSAYTYGRYLQEVGCMKKYLCCLLALGLLVGCSVKNDNSEIVLPPVEQIPEDDELDNDVQEIKLEDIVSIETIQVM